MKKILGITAILVAIGMGFIGCTQNVPAAGNNNNTPGIPQKELPASVGENPFKGNSYKSFNGIEYVFTENEVTEKYYGKVKAVYSYTYNTDTKLLAFKVSKTASFINRENLVTPEQYYNEAFEIYSSEQKYRTYSEQYSEKTMTDDEWKEFVKQLKKSCGLSETAPWSDVYNYTKSMVSYSATMNYYYSYDFEGSSLKVKEYTKPELTLKQYYTDYAIPNFSFSNWEESSSTYVSIFGSLLNTDSKSYIITDVTDTVIKVKESPASKTTLDIPYTMTSGTSPVLKITLDGKDYTLSVSDYWNAFEKQ